MMNANVESASEEPGRSGQTPYIGSHMSLISNSDIRYEGILYSVNPKNSTIALTKVRSFGTENRSSASHSMSAVESVFEFIIFKASDIKDLVVCQTAQQMSQQNPLNDPAIVSMSQPSPVQPEPEREQTVAAALLTQAPKPDKQPTSNYVAQTPLQRALARSAELENAVGTGASETASATLDFASAMRAPFLSPQGRVLGGGNAALTSSASHTRSSEPNTLSQTQAPNKTTECDMPLTTATATPFDARKHNQMNFHRALGREREHVGIELGGQTEMQAVYAHGYGDMAAHRYAQAQGAHVPGRGFAQSRAYGPGRGYGHPPAHGYGPGEADFPLDYDFQRANQKFLDTLEKMKETDVSNGEQTREEGQGEGKDKDKKDAATYNKAQSFFDHISVSSHTWADRWSHKAHRPMDRERVVNHMTFGHLPGDQAPPPPYRQNQGYGYGYMRY